MNAKLAAAISLGASSLALFAMAGVANAQTTETTPAQPTTPPVVQPSTDNPVEKAKGEANKAINSANEQKDAINTEVKNAEGEATDANSNAIEANNAVTEAQKDLENKQKEVKTAEEGKATADGKVTDQQTLVDKAGKDVVDKKAVLDKETENQTAAENKLKATQEEQNTANNELETANKDVNTKTTEQTKAVEKVKTETGNLQTAKEGLKTAQDKKQQAQEQANQLSSEATEKENKQKEANLKVKENTQKQENIQKEIDNLNAAGSGATNANVQDLEKKANAAEQAYNTANATATQKAQEAQKAHDDIDTKAGLLTKAEQALETQNSEYYTKHYKVIAAAERTAEEKAKAYNDKDKNSTKDDVPVEQKSDFYKFLQYVINTENAKGANKNADLITDAENAQKVLKGQTYTIPDKKRVVKNDTETITYTTPGYTAEAPTWYNDLVKPGLGRVGSADSLENMKQAATYYKALDDHRKEDVKSLKTVRVRLTLIAESIVHSFYSAANMNHAGSHDADGAPQDLQTHPYIHSAENLAWDADYNNYDSRRKKQDLGQCNTDSGHLSCSYDSKEKHNAVDGWYDLEKTIYNNAISAGKWKLQGKDYNLTAEGLKVLQNHRTDFGNYFYKNPKTKLFEGETNVNVTDVFREAVGHYTNFSEDDNFAAGFAKADNSKLDSETYQDIAVWHGSSESSISIEDYTKLLNDYADTVKGNATAPSGDAAENLRHLNADANSANMAVFDAKYDALKAKSNMSKQDRAAIEALENKIAEASTNFKKAVKDSAAANKVKEEAAKKAAELQTAWTTAKNAYEAAKQKAEEDAQKTADQRNQEIQTLTNQLNTLKSQAETLTLQAETAEQTAKAARKKADNKQAEVNGKFTQAITDAEATVKSAKESVATAEAAKAKVDKELKDAEAKVTALKQTIQTLETRIGTETQSVTDATTKVNEAKKKLDTATETKKAAETELGKLKEAAKTADTKLTNAKTAVKTAEENVVKKIKLAQTAVANAQSKVAEARRIVEAAKTKIENIQKNLKTAEEKFKTVVTTDSEERKSFIQSTFLAAYPSFNTFIETLTTKSTQLKDTATNLTKSASNLSKTLNKVAPEQVQPVEPPAPAPEPSPAPAPSPSPSIEDTTPDSGSGSASVEEPGEASDSDYAGSSDYSSSNWYSKYLAGYANNLFGSEQLGFHAAVPAAQSQSANGANGANGANAQGANGVAANNVAGAAHANTLSASSANRIAAALVAGAKAAAKNAAKADEAKKDDAKSESSKNAAKDSAKSKSKSDSKNDSKSESKDESKSAQAAGGEENGAQSASNSTTLKVVAALAAVVAGIAVIGGGTYLARHRRA